MNKQSILSLKKCALSLGIAAMAAGFTACSEKDMPNGPVEEGTVTSVGTDVNVVNDPSELDKYVTNYKRPGSRGSRATKEQPAAPEWSMPELPASTEDMTPITIPDWAQYQDPQYLNLSADGHTDWIVPEGVTLKFGTWGGNNAYNLYIYGTLEVQNISATSAGANIYIAPGGQLDITGKNWEGKVNSILGDAKPINLYIYNGSEYNGSYTSAVNTALFVEGDVNVGDATFGGTVYVGGQLTAGALETNNSSKFYAKNVAADSWTFTNNSTVYVENTIDITGNCTINAQNQTVDCKELLVGGKFHMENNSVLNAYEHIAVNGDFEVSTQGKVYTPCLYIAETFYIKNGGDQNNGQDAQNKGNINVPSKIFCKNFQADASGFAIYMDGDALFEAAETFTVENKGWTIEFENTAENPSAIVTKKFQIMEGAAAYIKGIAYLSAAEYWGKPSENFKYYNGEVSTATNRDFYDLQETVVATFDGVKVNSKPEDCTPEFTTPTPDTPDKITELITSIIHTHDTSATCIALGDNGKPYFSWHKRGTSIHGCLEAGALDKTTDTFALTSWMEVNDGDTEGGDNWGGNSAVSGADAEGEHQGQFDFNHLIVAEGQVVTVGDNAKKGGFIGAIALDAAGDFGTNGTLQKAFKSRQLLHQVEEKVGRSGNCVLYANKKYYIACAGGFQEYNGKINDLFVWNAYKNPQTEVTGYWTNSLGDYELTAGSAKHIAINPAGDKIATLELTSKGTHPDGDDYWFNDTETAIGAVLKVRDAKDWFNTTTWKVEIGDICPIYGKNAIAMDADGKVYVAAGGQGLLVYDNGQRVGKFSIAAEHPTAGANGLAIDDKYVYVAYGLGGLWILNKSDLSVVSYFKSEKPDNYDTEAPAASANYVAVDGQYIYVAYGRHGVKILKLN